MRVLECLVASTQKKIEYTRRKMGKPRGNGEAKGSTHARADLGKGNQPANKPKEQERPANEPQS